MADLLHRLISRILVEDKQFRTLYPHVGFWIDQPDACLRGSGPLVELSGQVFHRDVPGILPKADQSEGSVIGYLHIIGNRFTEYAVLRFLQQFGGETEKVVNIDEAQVPKVPLQV